MDDIGQARRDVVTGSGNHIGAACARCDRGRVMYEGLRTAPEGA
ncbi:MAG TPA: hypothetical protein VGL95_03955 [Acetobacteraceae bacterium]|jgi:hypothetical protein